MSVEPGAGVDRNKASAGEHPAMNAKLVAVGRAMASVVERARRLKMSSLEGYDGPTGKSSTPTTPRVSSRMTNSGGRYGRRPGMSARSSQPGGRNTATSSGATVRRPKKTETTPYHRTPRGGQSLTANLPVPPPPPPPSPRCPQASEIFLALEQADKLMAEYQETEQLTDNLLKQAEAIKRDLELQNELHRDVELVRDLEVETSGKSLLYLIEAVRAECYSEDDQAIRERCLQALARSERRHANVVDEVVDDEGDDTDTNTNSDTETEVEPESLAEKDDSGSDQGKATDLGNGKATQTDIESMSSSDYNSSPKSSSSSLQSGRSTLFYHMMHYVEDKILANIHGEPACLGLKMDMEPGEESPEEGIAGEGADLGAGDATGAHILAKEAVTKSKII